MLSHFLLEVKDRVAGSLWTRTHWLEDQSILLSGPVFPAFSRAKDRGS